MTDTTVETGEIHFFYRSQMDVDQPKEPDDLQRVFLALVPDEADRARLFIIGRKRLPEIVEGETDPDARHWLLLTMVASPKAVGKALHPVRYETETRGTRETAEAIPAGSGRYAIMQRDDATQLAYRLSSPATGGPVQKALRIHAAARYVIAVRNPDIDVPGFPDEKPEYPDALRRSFADERWIDISDARLLDYENAQLVLIGAAPDLDPLDVDLDGQADPFDRFGLDADDWPDAPLRSGDFAAPKGAADPVETSGDRSKGGKRGGMAAAETDSAAGVASALKGMSFPADRACLVAQAKDNDAPAEVIGLLKTIPNRDFETMADVAKAVGEVKPDNDS